MVGPVLTGVLNTALRRDNAKRANLVVLRAFQGLSKSKGH